jgi:hypothetical protein
MPSALLPSRQSNRASRAMRTPRIPLRWRIRAVFRTLRALAAEIIATQGHRRREDFLQAAAREVRERSEAIDGSVGAMSADDIRRIAPSAPDRRSADQP